MLEACESPLPLDQYIFILCYDIIIYLLIIFCSLLLIWKVIYPINIVGKESKIVLNAVG